MVAMNGIGFREYWTKQEKYVILSVEVEMNGLHSVSNSKRLQKTKDERGIYNVKFTRRKYKTSN